MHSRIVYLAFLLFAVNLAFGQQDKPIEKFWIPNGPVNKIVEKNGYIYLGGSFNTLLPKQQYIGGGAIIDTTDYKHNPNFGFVNGTVNCIVSDGNGGWYIGGTFKSIGDSLRNNIAHINADGSVHSWNPNANNSVANIVLQGKNIYVIGSFTSIGGQSFSKIAKLTDSSNVANSLFKPNWTGVTITALAATDSVVYLGGWVGTTNANMGLIERVSAFTGEVDAAWNPTFSGSLISQLTLDNDNLYLSGAISKINNQELGNLVCINAKTGVVNANLTPNINAQTNGIALHNEFVYVYGRFSTVAGKSYPYLARFYRNSGLLDETWNPLPNGEVTAIGFLGKSILLAGKFTKVGNQNTSFSSCVDSYTGNIDKKWTLLMDNSVNSIFIQGSTVFLGGSFKGYNGFSCGSIARINKTTGEPDFNWIPLATGTVNCIAFWNNRVIFAGNFSKVNETSQSNICKVDDVNGNIDNWNPLFNYKINTLLVSGNNLFVGGSFSNIAPYNRGYIAKFNLNSGSFNTTWNPNPNGAVNTIELYKNSLFVGGSFTYMGGNTSKAYFCKIDTASTGALDATYTETVDKDVTLIQIKDTVLYLFGTFTKTGSYNASNYSVLNLKTKKFFWKPILLSGITSQVFHDDYVYFGGNFTMHAYTVYNKTITNLSRFPTQTNIKTDSTWYPNPNDAVNSVITDGTNLYIGGAFTEISNTRTPYFTVFSLLPNSYSPTTNKDWNNPSNWTYQRPPRANEDAIITNDTIFVNNLVSAPALCKRLTINSNATLVVNPGCALTSGLSVLANTQPFFTNRNNGTILLRTDENNNLGSFNPGDSLTGSGSFKSEFYFKKNLLSNGSIEPVFFTIPIESELSNLYNPLVNKLSRYDSDIQEYVQITTNDYLLKAGIGYKIEPANSFKITHTGSNYTTTPFLYDFKPTYSQNINNGFCLLGNPLTSSIDWETYNFYNTFWFEKRNAQNKKVYEMYHKDIRIGTNNSGDSSNSNTIIAPNQGFFVKYGSLNQVIKPIIPNSSCTHLRYKSTIQNQIYYELLNVKLIDEQNNSDECLLFNDQAWSMFQYPSSPKLFSDEIAQCYFIEDTSKYTLLLEPTYDRSTYLGVKSINKGNYSFSFSNGNSYIDSLFFEDTKTGSWFSLKKDTIYSFNLDTGIVNDRFIIHLSDFYTAGVLYADTSINTNTTATLSLHGKRGLVEWYESNFNDNDWVPVKGVLSSDSLVYTTEKLSFDKYYRVKCFNPLDVNQFVYSNTVKVTVKIITLVKEPLLSEIKVTPNPFSDASQITIPNGAQRTNLVRIYDEMGKIILEESINQETYTIKRNNLKQGVYTLEVIGDKKFTTKLIVK